VASLRPVSEPGEVLPYVRRGADVDAPVTYAHGPDSVRHADVPQGQVVQFAWTRSQVFPGTERRFFVHVPAQYSPERPAAAMVFQDGSLYLDPAGQMRAGIVFDNLIHQREMPVTLGVFVDPGQPGNRNVEYDATSEDYATFLLTEVLPVVQERYHLSDDPDRWAVAGGSSGGNCAFTAAWNRPDRFRKVLSFVGSFAQIPGGNPYPDLIARSPRRPLRVFLQAASRDLNHDQPERNWFSNNLRVAAALAERGYDHRLVVGDGGHSPNHGGAVLPDALRWLWR